MIEWVNIPAGKVTLITEKGWRPNYIPEGESQTFDVAAFSMAKYPTTNAQYAQFIDAGGYREKRWWIERGWQAVTNSRWTIPKYWEKPAWTQSDYPVIGVSWYEAIAFCHWLSECTGEKVSLPTEQQWQWAAQGDDGRLYAWGDEWDTSRCNSGVHWQTRTSPVTKYEGKGDSPFGVVDLCGNVWEWCLTRYDTNDTDVQGKNVRATRGGSWYFSHPDDVRVTHRNYWEPGERSFCIGFRCVLV